MESSCEVFLVGIRLLEKFAFNYYFDVKLTEFHCGISSIFFYILNSNDTPGLKEEAEQDSSASKLHPKYAQSLKKGLLILHIAERKSFDIHFSYCVKPTRNDWCKRYSVFVHSLREQYWIFQLVNFSLILSLLSYSGLSCCLSTNKRNRSFIFIFPCTKEARSVRKLGS